MKHHHAAKAFPYVLAIFLTAVAVNNVNADLVLHVDKDKKEFFFTGTDTGKVGDFDQLNWRGGIVNGSPTNINVKSGFDSVPGATFQLRPLGVQLTLFLPDEEFHTFSGTSAKFGYGNASQAKISALEGLIGTSLQTAFNSTGSPIAVQQFSSVPEPTSFALLGFGILGLGMTRRRRI